MTAKKVKFSIGADAADAEPDNSAFYDGPVPPKGVYRARLKFLKLKTNRNDDPMLNGILEIDEKGEKAKFNGYGIWFNINVTKQGAPYVNNFLDAAGFSRKAFWGTGGVTLDTDDDPPTVLKIGTKTVNDPVVRVRTKRGSWNGDDKLDIAGAGFMPADAVTDEEADEETWDEESTDEEADDEVEEVDEAEDEEADDEVEEDDDTANWEYLSGLDREGLKAFIKANSLGIRVLKSMSDDDVRLAVANAASIEPPAADEEEEEDEVEEEDEEEEDDPGVDLDSLDRAGLKALIKERGLEVRVLKSMSDVDLRQAVAAALAAPPF